jgi:cytoskeletal protein RodZ
MQEIKGEAAGFPYGCKAVEFNACCIIAAESPRTFCMPISETLRQARLRSGVDLDKLAAKTKINPRYLEAIEKGDFDKLPGGIFARMFIKQYADAVGLDGASFAEEFQRSSQLGNTPSAHPTKTFAEAHSAFHPTIPAFTTAADSVRNERLTSMLSSLIWVVAVILVCAGAYYGLAHVPPRPAAREEAVAPKPAKTPETAPAPSSPAPTAEQPKPETAKTETKEGEAKPAENATIPPAAPAPATDPSAPVQLQLTATEDVWVTAIADGKTVVSEMMHPGSSKAVSASKGARITLGNAGGIDITFNGKKLEPFGPKGQVRTIDFSSFGAQVVSRTPPPASLDPLR